MYAPTLRHARTLDQLDRLPRPIGLAAATIIVLAVFAGLGLVALRHGRKGWWQRTCQAVVDWAFV